MKITAIICAAGKGTRAGFDGNKLFAPYLGVPVLERTIAAFLRPDISQIVVTYNANDEKTMQTLAKKYPIELVLGGDTRTRSVYNALQTATGEIVLIHDGARPFVSSESVTGCIESVKNYGSGICAVPAVNTIALSGENGEIKSVPNRADCYSLQTPQGFFLKDIARAYESALKSGKAYTDDSSVYAEFIAPPRLCLGSLENIKLTYAEDFLLPALRVGFGVDTHAFGAERETIALCGVNIPSKSGLIAHSDGDVALHALMDALLSAAGKRDIGYYFPDTDERYKGANSMQLLEQVLTILRENSLAPQSVSIAIQAETPRLSGYISQMRKTVAAALSIGETQVGITAGTNEKLGYVGEGKGITAYAYAALRESNQ